MVQVLVLPIHMEFTRSGEFTIWDRVLQSVSARPSLAACRRLAGCLELSVNSKVLLAPAPLPTSSPQ